jgi:adenylate cyclase
MTADDATAEARRRLEALVDTDILPGSDAYTIDEVAHRAGADVDTTRRLWRALGFADPGDDDRIGGELDVAVLKLVFDQELTPAGIESMIQQTRVMSGAINRITELWVDQIRVALDSGDPELVQLTSELTIDQDRTMWMLGYLHRRLLAAGLRRELANRSAGAGSDRSAVFADLVGFTTLTERLGPLELSRLVGTFEAIAHDTVAEHGGRLVKTIGDEVLFATDTPSAAVSTTAELMRRAVAAGLPPLRAGIDHGPTVAFEGDLFGSTVNRAARLVAEAPSGAIAASPSVRLAATRDGWRSIGVRELKGVGAVEVSVLDVIVDDTIRT